MLFIILIGLAIPGVILVAWDLNDHMGARKEAAPKRYGRKDTDE
jgi:hypothetical protein